VSVPTVLSVLSSLSRPFLTLETSTLSTTDLDNILSLDSSSVMLRRVSRSNVENISYYYGFPHSIDQYVDYSNLSTEYKTFITSLNNISKCWQVEKRDLKWEAAMHEELRALDKNCTWELVSLPSDKKTVGCK
jgi:hypothetical protein